MRKGPPFPRFDWIFQILPPRSSVAKHTLPKEAERRKISPPTASTGRSGRTWQSWPVAAGSSGRVPCVASLRLLGGRSVSCFCLANRAGNETKQNKMLMCWVMTNQDTCYKGEGYDSFTATLIIKTKQVNQHGFVCRTKQLYCLVNQRPQTCFRSGKPETLKISPKLSLIDILPILLVLFFNQPKA